MKLSRWPGHPGKIRNGYQPDMRPHKKGEYRNQKSWKIYAKDEQNQEYEITVPHGFISDGASVKRIAWTISGITPDGLIRGAALVHDFLCKKKGKIQATNVMDHWLKPSGAGPVPLSISYKDTHRLFYDLMKAAGMNWRARIAYTAVRLFGPRW